MQNILFFSNSKSKNDFDRFGTQIWYETVYRGIFSMFFFFVKRSIRQILWKNYAYKQFLEIIVIIFCSAGDHPDLSPICSVCNFEPYVHFVQF